VHPVTCRDCLGAQIHPHSAFFSLRPTGALSPLSPLTHSSAAVSGDESALAHTCAQHFFGCHSCLAEHTRRLEHTKRRTESRRETRLRAQWPHLVYFSDAARDRQGSLNSSACVRTLLLRRYIAPRGVPSLPEYTRCLIGVMQVAFQMGNPSS
jgi:hypothetical protein